MNKITVKPEILIYSFRYALGRMTYCVNDVVEALKNNWEHLDKRDKELILKEVKIAIYNNNIGMNMDKKLWEDILKLEV